MIGDSQPKSDGLWSSSCWWPWACLDPANSQIGGYEGLDAKRHRFDARLPAAEVRMQGDSARLAQVIVNLLDNASKYTPEGGHISLEAGVSGTTLEISVRDDGMGMPAELLPRVFDLFQQGERCSDGSGGGLGVGLTLVKSLVEMHGGQVSAESRGRGHGATFRIRLPIERAVPAEPDARPASLDTRVAGSGGMPVLLVEDNAAVNIAFIFDGTEPAADTLQAPPTLAAVQVPERTPEATDQVVNHGLYPPAISPTTARRPLPITQKTKQRRIDEPP